MAGIPPGAVRVSGRRGEPSGGRGRRAGGAGPAGCFLAPPPRQAVPRGVLCPRGGPRHHGLARRNLRSRNSSFCLRRNERNNEDNNRSFGFLSCVLSPGKAVRYPKQRTSRVAVLGWILLVFIVNSPLRLVSLCCSLLHVPIFQTQPAQLLRIKPNSSRNH